MAQELLPVFHRNSWRMAMASESGESNWQVREQIVEDPVSGLTIQLEVIPGTSAPFRLRLFGGRLPFGNREICFSPCGEKVGAGTTTVGACRPGWLTQLDL